MREGRRSLLLRYGVALVSATLVVLLRELLTPVWGDKLPFLTLYPAVAVSAWYGGLGPGLVATTLCALAAAYFWLAPFHSLAVAHPTDQVGLVLAVLVMLLITALVEALHRAHEKLERRVQERTADVAKANAVLESERARLTTTLEQLPVGVIISDASGDTILANAQAKQIWRYDALPGVGSPDFARYQGFSPDGRRYQVEDWPLTRALRQGETTTEEEITFLRGDGVRGVMRASATPILDGDGRVTAAVVAFMDITARKQAAEQLQRYAERVRLLQEIDRAIQRAQSSQAIAQAALPRLRHLIPCLRASVTVFDWEARESVLLAVDGELDAPVPMLGGNRLAFTAHPHLTLDTFQQGHLVMEEDLSALADPPPLFAIIRAAGVSTYMSVPLMTPDTLVGALHLAGGVRHVFSPEHREIAQEVAASLAVAMHQARLYEQVRQHAEELTQRVQERTAELQRANEDLRQVAYIAAHDLQEPVRMMGVYTQKLAKRLHVHLEAELTDAMAFVVEGAARIAAQLNDLLAYLEVDGKGQGRTPTDCETLLRQTLEQLQGPITASGAIVTHDLLPIVEANATQLQLVFHHLLDNALKFCNTAPPRVHVWAERQEGAWRFAVRDNGIGIAPRHAATLFGFFKRLHSRQQYPGTGMGLALCKKITERHGGRIWVESEVGSGATFYFTIGEAATRPHDD